MRLSALKNCSLRGWVSEHRFATVAAVCETFFPARILIEFGNRPLVEIATVLAILGTHLFCLVSIFCDQSPWPGLLLFWISILVNVRLYR